MGLMGSRPVKGRATIEGTARGLTYVFWGLLCAMVAAVLRVASLVGGFVSIVAAVFSLVTLVFLLIGLDSLLSNRSAHTAKHQESMKRCSNLVLVYVILTITSLMLFSEYWIRHSLSALISIIYFTALLLAVNYLMPPSWRGKFKVSVIFLMTITQITGFIVSWTGRLFGDEGFELDNYVIILGIHTFLQIILYCAMLFGYRRAIQRQRYLSKQECVQQTG